VNTGWFSPYNTGAAAFNSSPLHIASVYREICASTDPTLTLTFDKKQIWSFNYTYCWFRLTVNGVPVADDQGNTYYSGTNINYCGVWETLTYDLSAYANQDFTIAWESCAKYRYGYTSAGCGGDNVFIDNIVVVETDPCSGTPTPGSSTASSYSICNGTTVNLTNTGAESGSDITYQWQSTTNPFAYPFSDISGATSTTYGATPSVDTYYRLEVTCTTSALSANAILPSIVNVTAIPSITGTTGGSRCGTGTVDLVAAASAGTINWYLAASGGSLLGTGTSYTTPPISSNTTYYVDATDNGCTTASRTSVTATVNAAAVVSAGADDAACEGSTFTTSGSRSGGASSSTWSTSGSGNFANNTLLAAVYTPSSADIAAGSVVLTILTDDPSGPCGAVSDPMTLTIDQAATANAGLNVSRCEGFTIKLKGSRGGTATSSTWTTSGTGGFNDTAVVVLHNVLSGSGMEMHHGGGAKL